MLLLKNIRLSGANVTGKTATSSAVGALVGCVNGALTLENCQVYLSRSHGHVGPDANRNKQWLQGGDTGGLVGRIEAGGSSGDSKQLCRYHCRRRDVRRWSCGPGRR